MTMDNKRRLEEATNTSASASTTTTSPAAAVQGVVVMNRMTFTKQWSSAFKQYDYKDDDDDDVSTTSSTDTDTDSYDSSDSIDTDQDEQESQQAHAMVRAAFSRTLSVPAALCQLMGNNNNNNNGEPAPKRSRVDACLQSSRPRMPMVYSAPVLSSAVSTVQKSRTTSSTTDAVKPEDHLRALLKKKGLPHGTFSSANIKNDNFFLKVTPESVAAYDMPVVKAVRDENVPALCEMLYQQGRSLQCGNKFGESIVHTACRRGSLEVLKFLVDEAGVSIKVCCDYGRTPLHDACWTASPVPNFALISKLLQESPDLLHVTDVRGFTPLQYVMRDHWGLWCDFLDRQDVADLVAKELFE